MRFFSALFFTLLFLVSCNPTQNEEQAVRVFDPQAHRGGRGLVPENTILAAKTSVDYECTLEIDLQMSQDKKIVVSHDAYFSDDFSLTPEGDTLSKKDGRSRLLFNMPYDSIAKYDVGSKRHPGFPHQIDVPAVKPLLSELLDSVELYAQEKNYDLHYNMEIKSNPKNDGIAYSSIDEFVDLTMKIIRDKGIENRTMIQSFDKRPLTRVHEEYPEVETSFLVFASDPKAPEGYIEELGFTPDIFSPHFSIVTEEMVNGFHEMGVRVIPWTPNTVEEMQDLKDKGVDGIITDYPNLFAELR